MGAFLLPPLPASATTAEYWSAVQKDAHPAYFFLCAAQAAIERRKCTQRASQLTGGQAPKQLPEKPVPGQFLGQLAIPNSQRRLTDEEFIQFLEVILFLVLLR